ncbi:ABC transporter ATP-binding protein [Luminiphilus sp.]|jgi:putative ABC transport system ATP-binding protein|nr:ABC transporter ATP-binding protein [Luminiphilus sp.]MDA8797463.1 ABC transporter ATP-binding protein [Luminiphilus sp.]MDA8946195.1 ABC transporter ATP-binding protein [Luminiphilus sp.]MDA9915573.1 ABC transporter ATP-binding protein [Luminiphilus sp.]MDB2313571.1 ABC transporter ATP-binding protein [Luminiphilus sp.]
MIKTSQLSKRVSTAESELEILRGIELEIKQGETAAIVGASGSGKSTLLGLLAGLDTPSAGAILLDGINIVNLDEDQRATLRSQKVGFVFQSFQLLPALTALENVMLPLELAGIEHAREKSEEFLTRVGLDERLHHYPRTLSGGEQQRVAIARAFASQPVILFADEPTGNLDTATGANVIELLFGLNEEEGTTLVLVTHDNSLADRCQRKFTMVAGQLEESL